MSNKTQLSTNNERLTSLIQELQGKASGGSGAVETCTVTTRCGAPISGITTIGYYVDGNGTAQPLTVSKSSLQFTVQKNSIISLNMWSSVSLSSGGIAQLYYSNMQSAYFVTDDAVLDYAG